MELAKECFIEALALDVKNYDAFRELVEGGMMSSTEGELDPQSCSAIPAHGSGSNSADELEWEFIRNLSYRQQLSEDEANFVKLMYTIKLKKVSSEPKSAKSSLEPS
jgi:anaphase-promoting complex subunit 6